MANGGLDRDEFIDLYTVSAAHTLLERDSPDAAPRVAPRVEHLFG